MILKKLKIIALIFLSPRFLSAECTVEMLSETYKKNPMEEFRTQLCNNYFENMYEPDQINRNVCKDLITTCSANLIKMESPRYSIINDATKNLIASAQLFNMNKYYSDQLNQIDFFETLEKQFTPDELKGINFCKGRLKSRDMSQCFPDIVDGIVNPDIKMSIMHNFISANNANYAQKIFNEENRLEKKYEYASGDLKNKNTGFASFKYALSLSNPSEKPELVDMLIQNILNDNKNSDNPDDKIKFDKIKTYLVGNAFLVKNPQKENILLNWFRMRNSKKFNNEENLQYMSNFFLENGVTKLNLTEKIDDTFKKMRLKMAKEVADNACSAESLAKHKELSQYGNICSALNALNTRGSIKYPKFEEIQNSLDNNKQITKFEYNLFSSEEICLDRFPDLSKEDSVIRDSVPENKPSRRVEINPEASKAKVDSLNSYLKAVEKNNEEGRKEILDDLDKSGQGVKIFGTDFNNIKSAMLSSGTNASDLVKLKTVNNEELMNRIELSKDSAEAKIGLNNLVNNIDLSNSDQKLKMDTLASKLPTNGASTQASIPISNSNSNSSNLGQENLSANASLEEEIKRLENKAQENQIAIDAVTAANKNKNNINHPDSKDSLINELQLEKERLKKELEGQYVLSSEKTNLKDKASVSSNENKTQFSRALGGNEKNPEGYNESTNSNSANQNETLANQIRNNENILPNVPSSSTTSINSGSNANLSKNNSINKVFLSGLLLTQNYESTQDVSQIIADPKENDLITIADKTNGKPFLIRENGELYKIVPKLDEKGKLIFIDKKMSFEKIKLTVDQKNSLLEQTNKLRSAKEVKRIPTRKFELDTAIKDTLK